MSLFHTAVVRKKVVPAVGGSGLLSDLNAYYKLEDLTEEVSGLTLTNHATATFTAGKLGNAANFNGTTQYLSRADNSAYQMGTGDISMSAWFKSTGAGGFRTVVSYGAPGSFDPGYEMYLEGSVTHSWIGDGTNRVDVYNIGSVTDGNWHFYVATFDRAGSMSVYIDNGGPWTATITTVTGSVNSSFYGFGIGGRGNGGNPGDVSVDEVGLWSRLLTGAEIIALWNSGTGLAYPF